MATLSDGLKAEFYTKGSSISPTSTHQVPLLNASGTPVGSTPFSTFATYIKNNTDTVNLAYFQRKDVQATFGNIFIAVTRLNDNFPLYIKPSDWSSYNSTSAYHCAGVAVLDGGKGIVVAKDEFNGTKAWGGSEHSALVGTAVTSRPVALADMTGSARTTAIAANSNYSSTDYPAAWCHAYEQAGEASDGLAYSLRNAGAWWLPSLGELWMIYRNFHKINQVLTLIENDQRGTTMQLSTSAYWSSTEYSDTNAWLLNFIYGYFNTSPKTRTGRVRAVSAI